MRRSVRNTTHSPCLNLINSIGRLHLIGEPPYSIALFARLPKSQQRPALLAVLGGKTADWYVAIAPIPSPPTTLHARPAQPLRAPPFGLLGSCSCNARTRPCTSVYDLIVQVGAAIGVAADGHV